MQLDEAMRTTFSARDYTGEELPDAVLYDILETARFAPSGGNRQGNCVVVVREQATKDRLAELALPAAKRYAAQGKAGESPWNAVIPSKVSAAEIEATRPPDRLTDPTRKASVVLVFLVDLRAVASIDQNLKRVGVISGASIYPFVWNVLLQARQAGFGGTITTLAVAQEDEIKKLLNVPEHFAVAAVMPLGKPVKQLTKLRRRTVEEIAFRDRFDGPALTRP
jgi:nitroreductase